MNATNVKLEVKSVSKSFVSPRLGKQVEALRDISFEVKPHEFVSIVGPSGCGKSTLLSIVAGLETPTKGQVIFDNKVVKEPGREIGMMFQDYALFPWHTVRGNVEFGPVACGLNKNEQAEISARLIELVGLRDFENSYPHELSGGMKQRCALARMLANDPKVWLMDEPLAAVDLQTRIILQEELLRLWGDYESLDQRRPVLFVTHGIEEAVFLSDRVLVLGHRPGQIKEQVKVNIPRPRSNQRNTKVMLEQVKYIWDLLRTEAEEALLEKAP
jgi:NitT/TauT family transport system ATP-binding protein